MLGNGVGLLSLVERRRIRGWLWGVLQLIPKRQDVLAPVENLDVRVVRVLYLLCWSRRRGRTIAKDKATAKDKPTRSSEPSATTTSTAQVDGRIVYVSVTIYQSEQSRSHQPWNYPSGCSTRRGR